MARRLPFVVVVTGAFACLGATYPSTNFIVEAPTQQVAQQVATMAERYRREKALEWLGYEMPPWSQPCPIRVKVTMGSAGGATSFAFDRGQVLDQHMNIEGTYDRLLASVLPHEVTHTVFAHYFRCPVPRWADEGGAVLSEDDKERNRHDLLVRQILNSGRAIPLRRLFSLREYPNDVMALYAEGFSVADFLVTSSSRPVFLKFVAHGMQYGWDNAAQSYYRYRNVEDLEQAWLNHLKSTRRQQPAVLASNTAPGGSGVAAEPAKRVTAWLTAPPAQPLDAPGNPVFRGQAPDYDYDGNRPALPPPSSSRPDYLPDYQGAAASRQPPLRSSPPASALDRWLPSPGPQPYQPPAAHLGMPQFGNPPAAPPSGPRPNNGN
jgi:hypothetical protein